jgi:hypothetical protein
MPKKGQKLKPNSLVGGKNKPFKGKPGHRFKNAVKAFEKGGRSKKRAQALAGAIARAKGEARGQAHYHKG